VNDPAFPPASEAGSDPASPSGADLARAWFAASPFVGVLGLRLVSMEPERAVVEMPFRQELTTAGDIVHGGAIGSLIDTAAVMSAWSGHDPARGVRWGTVAYSVSFLAPARTQTVRAEASVSRRGRSVWHCRVEVTGADGATLAEALVAYRLG
jgi:uncharacterized protein (TIGR00369 family)